MQTPAERALVARLAERLREIDDGGEHPPRVLAVGAGQSLHVENQLTDCGVRFICDRTDVEDCRVEDPRVDRCWTCPIEKMEPVASDGYRVAFAHYVLEHVQNPEGAAKEIHRILKPGGVFVASFPNPMAAEFRIANATPLWFHKKVRGEHAWETHYAYGTVERLLGIFQAAGLEVKSEERFPFTEGYLHRFPGLSALGRMWDRSLEKRGAAGQMGQVCCVFGKP